MSQGAFRRKVDGATNGETPAVIEGPSGDADKQKERDERESLVLWKHPVTTLEYFVRELAFDLRRLFDRLIKHGLAVSLVLLFIIIVSVIYYTAGAHQQYVVRIEKKLLWCLYWVGLGVLSSVGLGTGLHTFLLYLGPHIASVTLAAYECGSLNFQEPPYPDEILCPEETVTTEITILAIMSKVRLEAFMWGAGTALGELPPYFMARASRLSGYDPDDEDDLKEFEELREKMQNPENMTWLDRAKFAVERLVERVGFIGILACASIPNPLFDLAGITCGHFLVPFWTFFGATLIGKAVIKMHIQKMFVIIAFNEALIEKAVSLLGSVPLVGASLQKPFRDFLVKQKSKLHRKAGETVPQERNILATIFECFVVAMILYFVVSIVNSLAQSYHKRMHKKAADAKKHAKD